MQKYKISFEGQNVFVGIDVHLKSWHVTAITESGVKYTLAIKPNAKVLFETLNRRFPDAHFIAAYEAGFTGFATYYSLMDAGIETIAVNAADIPTSQKEQLMKTDAVDSEKIARSLRAGELHGSGCQGQRAVRRWRARLPAALRGCGCKPSAPQRMVFFHYDLMFNRLMYRDGVKNTAKLYLRKRKTGEVVAVLNLPSILAEARTAYQTEHYTPQEYLDREYDYRLQFFLVGAEWQYLSIDINVLGWSKRIQNVRFE